jgi:hypothetical protein
MRFWVNLREERESWRIPSQLVWFRNYLALTPARQRCCAAETWRPATDQQNLYVLTGSVVFTIGASFQVG